MVAYRFQPKLSFYNCAEQKELHVDTDVYQADQQYEEIIFHFINRVFSLDTLAAFLHSYDLSKEWIQLFKTIDGLVVVDDEIDDHQPTNPDRQILQNLEATDVKPLQASKNGRVYTGVIHGSKKIIKFQTTLNNLSFLKDVNLDFIPKIHAYEETLGQRWYVQDFIDGLILEQWCDSNTTTPEKRARICREIERIQSGLMEKKLIHGDIHPGNLLVHDDRVYLIDLDNSFLAPPAPQTVHLIKPTGAEGFCHPDIKKGKRFPSFYTEAYSFKRIVEFVHKRKLSFYHIRHIGNL